MRNISWILLLLVVQGCASAPSEPMSLPQSAPLPEAVLQDRSAMGPNSLTENLEHGLNDSLEELKQLLDKLRK